MSRASSATLTGGTGVLPVAKYIVNGYNVGVNIYKKAVGNRAIIARLFNIGFCYVHLAPTFPSFIGIKKVIAARLF